MAEEIIFEELGEKERILLLKAFNYDVDKRGYVLDLEGNKIKSKEYPREFIHIKNAILVPGSLDVIESTPTAISKFIRERIDSDDGNTN